MAIFSVIFATVLALAPLISASVGFDNFGSVGFDNFGSVGFDNFGSVGFDNFGSVGFDNFGSVGFDDSAGAGTGSSDGSTGTSFGPFDDNFQPFDDIPGNPGGPDVIVPGDGGGFPICTVDCEPGPGPTPGPGDDDDEGDDDRLKIFIHQIFLDDPFSQEPGNLVHLRITFENDGNKDMDDTKVIVVVPDFAARDTVGPFDLDVGKQVTKTLLLELPEDVQPGTYPVRLYIHNLRTQRAVHREIEIVDYS